MTDTGTGRSGSHLLLALGAFALGMDAYVVAGLLPDLAASFEVTPARAGQLVTAFTLSYAVAAPVLATLVSAVRPARVLVGALGVFTLGNTLSVLSPGLATLELSRVVAGAGAGLFAPAAAAAAAALVSPGRRARAVAVVLAGMSGGTVAGVPLGLLLNHLWGWRTTLTAVTVAGAGALAGLAVRLPPVAADPVPSLGRRIALFADPRVAAVVAVTFLQAVASLGLYTYLVPVLRDLDTTAATEGCLWVWGVGGVLGSVSTGWVLDRVGRRDLVLAVLLLGLALAAAGLPVLARHHVVLLPLLLWGAVGWGFVVPQQHRLLAGDPATRGPAVALNSSATYLGSAVGALGGGGLLAAGMRPAALPGAAAVVAVAALGLHSSTVLRRSEPAGRGEPGGVNRAGAVSRP